MHSSTTEEKELSSAIRNEELPILSSSSTLPNDAVREVHHCCCSLLRTRVHSEYTYVYPYTRVWHNTRVLENSSTNMVHVYSSTSTYARTYSSTTT